MKQDNPATYYVDEAGDGVLFGRQGRVRINEPDGRKFFMLGMVNCPCDQSAETALEDLRQSLLANPLYSGIPSMSPEARKTARFFHAKDDHPEVRARVFELLTQLEFRFYAVVKEMRDVLDHVRRRNEKDSSYRYHPNELYDRTTRMLFNERLHKQSAYQIIFARRGNSDRTLALKKQLQVTREHFLKKHEKDVEEPTLEICPAYPWQRTCLQIADYALWALQRCYEKGEDRFLRSIWNKVAVIRDVDDPNGKHYGTYFTRKTSPPDIQAIKNRWV